MDRDNRTRTGAKDPWGRAAPMPLAQRPTEARPGPDTEPDQHVVWKWAKGRCKPRAEAGMPGAGLTAEAFGKARPDRLALSRTGENPPYGILGRAMETSASCEARSAPSPYPTPHGLLRQPRAVGELPPSRHASAGLSRQHDR